MMTKEASLYILLSILIIWGAKYLHLALVYFDMGYYYFNVKLQHHLSAFNIPLFVYKVVSLTVLPLLITGIPALLYRTLKKRKMPHFLPITWIVWMVIVLSRIILPEG